jgi:hypothetical protein
LDKIDHQNAGFFSITIVEMNHEIGGFDQRCVVDLTQSKLADFALKVWKSALKLTGYVWKE